MLCCNMPCDDTLQCSTACYNDLLYGMLYGALWYGGVSSVMVWRRMLLFRDGVICYSTMWYAMLWYGMGWDGMLHSDMVCCVGFLCRC